MTKRNRLDSFLLLGGCSLLLASCGARQQFNQDRALGATETIRAAQENFKLKNGRFGTMEELKSSNWGTPTRARDGYEFRLEASRDSFCFYATPIEYKDKSISFYVDQSGLIRGMLKNGVEANAQDPLLLGVGINPTLTPSPP